MICSVPDRAQRYRCPDLLDLGDHLDGFGSRLLTSEVESGKLLFASRVSDPLFIPQIAACVRFWTRILRRIALTWTFTVASAMSIFRAMHLLESPSIRQRR